MRNRKTKNFVNLPIFFNNPQNTNGFHQSFKDRCFAKPFVFQFLSALECNNFLIKRLKIHAPTDTNF